MKKVMILEDEVSIRSFVVINLKRAGYEVVEAGTGEEALELLKGNPDVGVAILDIMLPGNRPFVAPSAVIQTRQRLGIEAVRRVFTKTAQLWHNATPHPHWCGLTLLAIDGVLTAARNRT